MDPAAGGVRARLIRSGRRVPAADLMVWPHCCSPDARTPPWRWPSTRPGLPPGWDRPDDGRVLSRVDAPPVAERPRPPAGTPGLTIVDHSARAAPGGFPRGLPGGQGG